MYLEVVDLRKSYGEGAARRWVLDGVSCSLERGEMAAIIGSSGCGKSTLLNCIGGLETFEDGDISIAGMSPKGMGKKQLEDYRREEISFVFQNYNLIPNLCVRDNVRIAERLSDRPLDYDKLMQALSIHEVSDLYPSQISGGQQQRAAIARALIKNPALLLCDEPTGALDSASAKETLMLLEQVNRTYGTTILMVTHNGVIPEMMTRTFVMKDGSIVSSEHNNNPKAASELVGL